MINVFAKASNTLMLFSCMLCKGVFYAEVLISIYRVSWTFVAVGECPLVLCHVSWDPPTYTWILGKTDILQNVVVFLRILQNVVVFLRIFQNIVVFLMIFIWVHVNWRSDVHLDFLQMNVTWISGLYLKICFVRLQNVPWSDFLCNLPWNKCRIS